jgi:glycerol-3-phosphate acyltransferase PlsY
MYPVTLGFRGGKGLACLVGVYFALDPLAGLLAAVIIVVITLVTDYIALATILLAIVFPVFTYFRAGEYAIVAACLSFVPAICMLIKHRKNIKRMLNGTEIGLRKASSGKYRSNDKK